MASDPKDKCHICGVEMMKHWPVRVWIECRAKIEAQLASKEHAVLEDAEIIADLTDQLTEAHAKIEKEKQRGDGFRDELDGVRNEAGAEYRLSEARKKALAAARVKIEKIKKVDAWTGGYYKTQISKILGDEEGEA